MAHIVIVGGGVAAGKAAETLRKEGYDGDVTVVAAEPHPPYQRPPLSKGYLGQSRGRCRGILHPPSGMTPTAGSTCARRPGDAPRSRRITDSASTADPSLTPSCSRRARRRGGSALEGTTSPACRRSAPSTTRTRCARELRGGGRRLVLIGSGWIGMEVAATARTLGNEVTVLERDAVPLAAAVGAEMGEVFRRLHEENGVDLATERAGRAHRGRGRPVEGVDCRRRDRARRTSCSSGWAPVPNTALAEAAGHRPSRTASSGRARCDERPDVYAAGDVANAYHPVDPAAPAQRALGQRAQGRAGRGGVMIGQIAVDYDGIPYFYTDQFDLGMELSGYPPLMADAELIIRGDSRRASSSRSGWTTAAWSEE